MMNAVKTGYLLEAKDGHGANSCGMCAPKYVFSRGAVYMRADDGQSAKQPMIAHVKTK